MVYFKIVVVETRKRVTGAHSRRSLRSPLEMKGVHVLYLLVIQLTASKREAYIFSDSFYFSFSQHITVLTTLYA